MFKIFQSKAKEKERKAGGKRENGNRVAREKRGKREGERMRAEE